MEKAEHDPASGKDSTVIERSSERELTVRRHFEAPVSQVFAAWTRPEQLLQWWAPTSFGVSFLSCEADVRSGGSYRFAFSHPSSEEPMVFFGRYIEVVPPGRLVWTNEESGEAGAVTTVTFEEDAGGTLVVMRDLYPSRQALDDAMASGGMAGFCETFAQLDALLAG